MNNGELQYLFCLENLLHNGIKTQNRTGVDAFVLPHLFIQHDMSLGFPLLTTKKIPFKTIRVELEGFIKGITDKSWFQERGCHIWDEWCSPPLVNHIKDPEERKKAQLKENFLGPVYGAQWRHFNGSNEPEADQLKQIVERLKSDPTDRRMLCSAWNPLVLSHQALPPCHVLWHVTVVEDTLHLCWMQRSVDAFLGLPFNIASYGLLLHLLAKELKLKEGKLSGFLSNVHLYENHINQAKQQMNNEPYSLPIIETSDCCIFDWSHEKTKLLNYRSHPKIVAEIAI